MTYLASVLIGKRCKPLAHKEKPVCASPRPKPAKTPRTTISTSRPKDCLACPTWRHCTRSKTDGRQLTVLPEEQYRVLQETRQLQKSEAFKQLYQARAALRAPFPMQSKRSMCAGNATADWHAVICNTWPPQPLSNSPELWIGYLAYVRRPPGLTGLWP